nr:serine hydrolase domain-containing protein [Kribbella amoyensis]
MVVPGVALAAPGNGDRSGLQERLDAVVADGSVGTLAEVRDGRRVWRGASGVAEVGTSRPVPVEGRVRVGSITKTFLATVVLQLVGEGRMGLDDSVEKWLPGVVPNGERITLRHLLNHTSGLPDYRFTLERPNSPKFLEYRWRTWTADEQIQRALTLPPTSEEPGKAYSYTNTGYLLLGQIVEKATGRSYAEEIERRVLRPLHLRNTVLPGTGRRIAGPHPHGYVPTEWEPGKPELVDFTEMNPSLFGAGGEMISTMADLNRFVAALLGGRLLPPHLLDEMKKPAVEGKAYGLGLAWRDTTCGRKVYGNDGDAVSYQTWSFTTEDGRHRAALALTPNFTGDVDPAVDAFLDKAICG